ncbi:MAG: 50S ribosomal protein L35 [Spirochaetales bacterium]|nr:50S ribosomal protein L35 [Spirochaetales bacterium]
MPKMKTRRSAAKRYSVTGSGKVRYKKQGLRHILTKKSSKRKRNLRHAGILSKSETKRIHKLMPYNF